MPLNHNLKILFVHIPKCGGTSIENFFNMKSLESMYSKKDVINENGVDFSLQHLTPKLLRKHPVSKNVYNEYTTFTVIRNPYERVLSEYFWLHKLRKIDISICSQSHFLDWFNDFFKVIDKDHKLSQCNYVFDEDGTQAVDHILRLENINNDLKFLLKNLDNPPPFSNLPKCNRSKRIDNILSDSAKKAIADLYKEDFERLNYEI